VRSPNRRKGPFDPDASLPADFQTSTYRSIQLTVPAGEEVDLEAGGMLEDVWNQAQEEEACTHYRWDCVYSVCVWEMDVVW